MPRIAPIIAAALAIAGIGWAATGRSAPIPASRMPAPPADPATAKGMQTAIFAGGCFWGMEGLFEHVKGVAQVTSGYAGGTAATANYPDVSTETTGHAEAIRITYDPRQVSYGDLLRIYFSVGTDPTQVNAQFPDTGTSYRSAIFPQNGDQKRIAADYIAMLSKAHIYSRPIATHLEAGNFYPAEAEHQGFFRRNPNHPYIVTYDLPKVHALKAEFPGEYKS